MVPLTPLSWAAGTEIVTWPPAFTADVSVCGISSLTCHPPPVRNAITGSAMPAARRLAIDPLGTRENLGCGRGEAWPCAAEAVSPAGLTVSPGWPSMATTVPPLGATISVAASFIRAAARRARSLASWAWATTTLAAADPSACRAARLALSAVIAARSARTAADFAAPASVASTSPLRTACPRWTRTRPTRPAAPKLRLAMPLLLTTPVNERLSAARIDGT